MMMIIMMITSLVIDTSSIELVFFDHYRVLGSFHNHVDNVDFSVDYSTKWSF